MRRRGAGGEAAGERDDAVGVAREAVEVDARLAAVEALEEAGAGELDEVAEALVGGGEQRQVVALDLALADRAVVDEVGLEAEDRLDVVLLAGLVELDRAVHHPVVGEPERGLAEGGRAGGQALDVRRAVEQRVLGVNVQVRAGVECSRSRPHRARSDGAAACPHVRGMPRHRPWARSSQAFRRATAARSPRTTGGGRAGPARRAGDGRTPRGVIVTVASAPPSGGVLCDLHAAAVADVTYQVSGGSPVICWATVKRVVARPRGVDHVGERAEDEARARAARRPARPRRATGSRRGSPRSGLSGACGR